MISIHDLFSFRVNFRWHRGYLSVKYAMNLHDIVVRFQFLGYLEI